MKFDTKFSIIQSIIVVALIGCTIGGLFGLYAVAHFVGKFW